MKQQGWVVSFNETTRTLVMSLTGASEIRVDDELNQY